jgi:hypothetical protein
LCAIHCWLYGSVDCVKVALGAREERISKTSRTSPAWENIRDEKAHSKVDTYNYSVAGKSRLLIPAMLGNVALMLMLEDLVDNCGALLMC